MIKSKKAQIFHGFNPFYFLMAGIIFLVMAFVLVLTTGQYLKAFLAYDKDIPTHIYAYRAINTCLAYQDNVTERYYPGVIDFSKYNQESLDACYADTSKKSFNIQLKDSDKPESYNRILVGFGASMNIKSYPVWIRYNDGTMNKGELLFGIS